MHEGILPDKKERKPQKEKAEEQAKWATKHPIPVLDYPWKPLGD